MEPARRSESTPPSLSGAPIQQSEEPPAVSTDWLSEFEKTDEAERLERLDTDRELVAELRQSNFSGAHYTYYSTELAKYGLAVISGWTIRGLILHKVATKGHGGLPPPLDRSLEDSDVVQELANETVAVALKAFRERVLIPGRWDPSKGASIKTYFIGQCLMQFANVYRRWHRETYREEAFLTFDGDIFGLHSGQSDDVATIVSRNDHVTRTLATIKDPRVQQAFVLSASGHTHAQIALRLNVSTKAVERMIAHARGRILKGKVA